MTQPQTGSNSGGDLVSRHRPEPHLSAAISWAVILACVALLIGLNHVFSEQRAFGPPDALAPNIQLEIAARYAVGTKTFLPRPTDRSAGVDPTAIYLRQLDTVAKSTPDHLRVAIAAGELGGASTALQRIDAMASTLNSPSLKTDAKLLRSIYGGNATLNDDDRQRLVARYGWFGHLALGFGKGGDDPDRKLANAAALRAVLILICVGLIAFFALIAGLALLVIALVRLADGKVHLAYRPATQNTGPFLEAFAIYLALMIGVSLLVGRFSGHLNISAAYILAGGLPVVIALAWPLVRGVTWPELKQGLGWHAGKGLIPEMFFGIVGYIAGLPLLAAAAFITFALSKVSGEQASHPIVNEVAGFQSALRLFFLASVFAPLVEESLFRGALFHHLRGRHRWWLSALIVSLLFAAIHPQGWTAIPPLATIALTFCAIREWRGTIVASAAAHALNNGVIVLVLVIATS